MNSIETDNISRDSIALVTGAGRGLGLAISKRLASDGCIVIATDADPSAIPILAETFGDNTLILDVTSDESVRRAFSKVSDKFGRLDVLVNNAGILSRSPSHSISSSSWNQQLDVNLGGVMRCCREAFPLLKMQEASCVINVGSVGTTLGLPHRLAYSTSKAGVGGLTRTLASEWGPYGIRVNAIAPGYIKTKMMEAGVESGELDAKKIVQRTPLRRFGSSVEIASAASFLASADASFVSGATLRVDGGLTVDGTFHEIYRDNLSINESALFEDG